MFGTREAEEGSGQRRSIDMLRKTKQKHENRRNSQVGLQKYRRVKSNEVHCRARYSHLRDVESFVDSEVADGSKNGV